MSGALFCALSSTLSGYNCSWPVLGKPVRFSLIRFVTKLGAVCLLRGLNGLYFASVQLQKEIIG